MAATAVDNYLEFYYFVGRIIGMAIFHQKLLDGYFILPFYKQILNIPVGLKDLEAVDPEYHRSLVWMLENDITDVLELTFSVNYDELVYRKPMTLNRMGATNQSPTKTKRNLSNAWYNGGSKGA